MSVGSLLVLVPSLALGDVGGPPSISPSVVGEIRLEPNPRLARKYDREPTPVEWERIESVGGKSPTEVICVLGHPSKVDRINENVERWRYGWEEESIGVEFYKGEAIYWGIFRQTGVISEPQLVQ